MPKAKRKRIIDRIALLLFLFAVAFLIFCYGFAVGKYKIFPYRIFSLAKKGGGSSSERSHFVLENSMNG